MIEAVRTALGCFDSCLPVCTSRHDYLFQDVHSVSSGLRFVIESVLASFFVLLVPKMKRVGKSGFQLSELVAGEPRPEAWRIVIETSFRFES